MPHMRREGTVFILDLGQGGEPDTENRFTPQWFTEANTCLERGRRIERARRTAHRSLPSSLS